MVIVSSLILATLVLCILYMAVKVYTKHYSRITKIREKNNLINKELKKWEEDHYGKS